MARFIQVAKNMKFAGHIDEQDFLFYWQITINTTFLL